MSAKRPPRMRLTDREINGIYARSVELDHRRKRARQVIWLVAAIALLPASLIVLALVIAALGGY